MKFTRDDLLHLQNLIGAINKATFKELDTDQVVASTRSFQWLTALVPKMQKAVEEDEALASVKVQTEQELKSPVKTTTKKRTKKATKKGY